MQLPQIRLESQMARINIQQTSGKQSIEQPRADLSIKQPKAELSITTTPSRLTIDQTQAWEDMNLVGTLRQTEINAQDGRNGVMEGMGRRAEQGNQLMQIEYGGNAITNQAIANSGERTGTIGLKYIPSPFSVKIDYTPSSVQINAQANSPIIDAQVNKPEIDFNRGSVNVQMEKYNQLDIDFTNLYSEII